MTDDKFASLIRRQRTTVGLSQKALAKRISTKKNPTGVWATYIGQLEKGEKIPSAEVIVSLANALDIDPYLLIALAFRERADTDEEEHLAEVLLSLVRAGVHIHEDLNKGTTTQVVGGVEATRQQLVKRILNFSQTADEAKWAAVSGIFDALTEDEADNDRTRLVRELLSKTPSLRHEQLLRLVERSAHLDENKWTALCNMADAFSKDTHSD